MSKQFLVFAVSVLTWIIGGCGGQGSKVIKGVTMTRESRALLLTRARLELLIELYQKNMMEEARQSVRSMIRGYCMPRMRAALAWAMNRHALGKDLYLVLAQLVPEESPKIRAQTGANYTLDLVWIEEGATDVEGLLLRFEDEKRDMEEHLGVFVTWKESLRRTWDGIPIKVVSLLVVEGKRFDAQLRGRRPTLVIPREAVNRPLLVAIYTRDGRRSQYVRLYVLATCQLTVHGYGTCGSEC